MNIIAARRSRTDVGNDVTTIVVGRTNLRNRCMYTIWDESILLERNTPSPQPCHAFHRVITIFLVQQTTEIVRKQKRTLNALEREDAITNVIW